MSKGLVDNILVGTKFGRWVVVEAVKPNGNKQGRYYTCRCECGTEKQIRGDSLSNGESSSCGCLAREKARERSLTHGLSRHPLYQVWDGMKKRCYNPLRKDYKHYGGRGIRICDEWMGEQGLSNFISDMYASFEPGLEIDRTDVNGDYEKDNCKWVTRRKQVINRRPTGVNFDTHYLTFNNKTLCMSEWADEIGIPATMLSDRISKLGWDVEKALTQKPKSRGSVVEIDGHAYKPEEIFNAVPNVHSLATRLGISAYEYLALLFNGVGVVKILLCKEWLEVRLTDELLAVCIDSNKVPPIKESFPHRGLVLSGYSE